MREYGEDEEEQEEEEEEEEGHALEEGRVRLEDEGGREGGKKRK